MGTIYEFSEEDDPNPIANEICKVCSDCNECKLLSEFHHTPGALYSVDHRCKECKNQQSKEVRDARRRLKYKNHTKPDACECCGSTKYNLNLDHDHTTGEFRGWLCPKCNTAIGALGDTLEGVQKAVAYLKLAEKRAENVPTHQSQFLRVE